VNNTHHDLFFLLSFHILLYIYISFCPSFTLVLARFFFARLQPQDARHCVFFSSLSFDCGTTEPVPMPTQQRPPPPPLSNTTTPQLTTDPHTCSSQPTPFVSCQPRCSYDQKAQMLVSNPVPEYSLLHNSTYLEGKALGPCSPGSSISLPYPETTGATSDTLLSFDVSGWSSAVSGFGVAARSWANVTFSVDAPDAKGARNVTVIFSEGAAAG
jgi:hypothetical protein